MALHGPAAPALLLHPGPPRRDPPPRPRADRILKLRLLVLLRGIASSSCERLSNLLSRRRFVQVVVHDVHAFVVLRRLRRLKRIGLTRDPRARGRRRAVDGVRRAVDGGRVLRGRETDRARALQTR